MSQRTDKELLELAAKAAGYETKHDKHGGEIRIKSGNIWPCWNPLTDDGAAFRLAVKLDMNVDVQGAYIRVDCGDDFVNEQSKDTPIAATRRAIVRAAAEIGAKL
jgi:hypothetical protein